MRKKRVDPALVLWSAAIVLFAGAFFLGRATLRGLLLETQRTAPGSTAQDEWRSRVEEKAATAAEKSARVCLNTAAKEELLALPGVGEKTALKLIAQYGKEAAGPVGEYVKSMTDAVHAL